MKGLDLGPILFFFHPRDNKKPPVFSGLMAVAESVNLCLTSDKGRVRIKPLLASILAIFIK